MRIRRVATVLALASFATVAASASDARLLLERFLARAGTAALRDLTLEQDLTVFNPEGRTPFATGTQRVIFRFPDRQRIEQVIDGARVVRLTVGARTWHRGSDGKVAPLPASRGQTVTLAVPVHRTADEMLAEWRALGIRDDRFHETRLGGRTVAVIGAQRGDRDRPAVWLDPEYGVMRFVVLEPSDTGSVLTDVSFSDHRPLVGALFFPYRQETFRSGKLLVRLIVRSVAVNTDPPAALFDPAALAH